MKNINLEKAESYLSYDEETSLNEMVNAIYKQSLIDPSTPFQDVDGVQPIESLEYSSMTCKEFIDNCYGRFNSLKLSIDSESVNIYIDNGENEEPTHVAYWHEDEWLEDAETVVPAMLKAIDLYHRDPEKLLKTLNIELF